MNYYASLMTSTILFSEIAITNDGNNMEAVYKILLSKLGPF
jgi:hypothetical protein